MDKKSEFMRRKPAPAKGCLFKKTPTGSSVVVNLNNGVYYTLNGSGHIVWQAMDGRRTVSQIADRAARAFSIARSRASRDVERFIRELERSTLVRLSNPR